MFCLLTIQLCLSPPVTIYGYLVDVFTCELEKVSQWTKANYLSLNVDKNLKMVFSKRNINHIVNHHVVSNGQVVKSARGKLLGLIIDDGLGFCGHIDYVSRKKSKIVVIFHKLRCLSTEDIN